MKIFWFIPTHGDSRYLGTSKGARQLNHDYLKQVAVAADSLGYEGVLIPTGIGATSATGLCDGVYANPLASQGLRQVRRFGLLWSGAACGAFAVNLTIDLANRGWFIGGRLSALGRTKA